MFLVLYQPLYFFLSVYTNIAFLIKSNASFLHRSCLKYCQCLTLFAHVQKKNLWFLFFHCYSTSKCL